ncbi:MAG: sulfotransferase [Oleiphilaceae bacterium]|nr:sulfotransferase [Oleiphilaceae bacterium]
MTTPSASELLATGNHFLNQNNLPEAKRHYQQALEQNPDESKAHFLLGWIAHQEQQPELALNHLQSACAQAPSNKEYVSALAQVLEQLQRTNDIPPLYQRYITHDATHPDIWLAWAISLAKAGQAQQAAQVLQDAIKKFPDVLALHMNFGELLYHHQHYNEALQVYQNALDSGLKSEGLYQNIAKLHTHMGQVEAARKVLEQGMQAYPGKLVFAYRLATINPDYLSLSMLRDLAEAPAPQDPENSFYYHWLMASLARQQDQAFKEMEHLVEAHSLYAQSSRFQLDTAFYLDTLPQLATSLAQTHGFEANAELAALAPVFVVGTPRCGSTLIENVICAGQDALKKGEETGVALQALVAAMGQNNGAFWPAFQSYLKQGYQQHQLLSTEKGFTDKSLENIFLVPLLQRVFPKAKFILVQRQPLASTVSILQNNMAVLPWAHAINDILRYVDNCEKTAAALQQTMQNKLLTVHYEDFVAQPAAASQTVKAFCALTWDESCLSSHADASLFSKTASHVQVREAIHQKARDRQQPYTEFFAPYRDAYPWVAA